MGGGKDDHSIDSEPHFQQRPFAPDSSEDEATRRLERDRAAADPDEERACHSVFDEPATLPNRPHVLIDRDWACRNCGYNLRGLMTAHPCPECGRVERYEPPRGGESTYAGWLAEHKVRVSRGRAWLVAGLVSLPGLAFGIVGALMCWELAGAINFIVFGPAVSEMLKIAACSTILDRRSFLIRRAGQIYLMTLGTAVLFATAQNAVYLMLLFPNSPIERVAYRWFACLLLHVLCTSVAGWGLVCVWGQALHECRTVSVTRAYPYVVAAIILHGVYNACIFFRSHVGYGF